MSAIGCHQAVGRNNFSFMKSMGVDNVLVNASEASLEQYSETLAIMKINASKVSLERLSEALARN